MRIVNGSNLCEDYPFEWFVNVWFTSAEHAEIVAAILNQEEGPNATRYWNVVSDDYVLDNKGPNE